jgi:hypothetical protein
MASVAYMSGRKKYQRPQAILFANNPGTLVNGVYIPDGYEVGTNPSKIEDSSLANSFLILSDNNREELSFSNNRIEKRERMINGRMRSYHIADKLNLSVQWNMLPSRAYGANANFDTDTGKSPYVGNAGRPNSTDLEFTTDGGAGGVELLDWYNNNTGSFWVYLAYDNYKNFEGVEGTYGRLGQYNEIVEVFFSAFDYSVQKRGGTNYDFWNISLSLEEV